MEAWGGRVGVVKRSNKRVSRTRMTQLLRTLLDASTLFALATVTPSGKAHINTAYFAWMSDFRLVWLSATEARHSRNLSVNSSVAAAIFDSNQVWGNPDRGLQVFGTAAEARGELLTLADSAYRDRFAGTRPDLLPYRFYVLTPRKVKLFDERELGAGVFVTARIGRGGTLDWERTEVYDTREGDLSLGY